MTYDEQLRTSEWKERSEQIKKRDSYCCALCFSPTDLNVHHKTYLPHRLAWEYEDIYLITLCKDCHKKFHGTIEQGTPHESDFMEERWRQIKRDLESIRGLNERILMKEIERESKEGKDNG